MHGCESDECLLPGAEIYVRMNRTMNVTLPEDVEEFIFQEVHDVVHQELDEAEHSSSTFVNSFNRTVGELDYEYDWDWVDFNQTSIWPASDSAISWKCLERGEASQWNMWPVWVCVGLRAVGCDGVEGDVAVEACGLPTRWQDVERTRSTLLSSWNVTEIDPDTLSASHIRVENATFEDGERARSPPGWGTGGASGLFTPSVMFFGLLASLVSMAVL
jgi:hypothetical protein